MDFSQSEEQVMIARQARELLRAESPTRAVRELAQREPEGFDRGLWQKMAQAGWLGIATPQKYGGQGSDISSLFTLCEEMGRVGLVGPFAGTVVMAAQAILAGGSEAQKKKYLPQIARGEAIFAFGMYEAGVENNLALTKTAATPNNDGYTLSGTKLYVPFANVADYLLIVARIKGTRGAEGLSLFVLPAGAAGVSISIEPSFGLERVCTIRLRRVELGRDSLIGAPGKAAALLDKVIKIATVARMCEMLRGMESAMNITVDYVKERQTWGYPVGSRQAIQHGLADVSMGFDLSRMLVHKAAWALASGQPAHPEISMAKSYINERYRLAVKTGIQFHGAIAYCIDHDLQVFIKHSRLSEAAFGSSDYHLARLADRMGI